MPKPKPCTEEGCPFTKRPGHPKWCQWHWLLRQPAATQVAESSKRLREARRETGFIERPRVPERDWPAGHRWCSGCQSFVPLFYASGSRCRGCASKAAHASHVKRTYGLDYETYERLLAFQGGRCYVCGQVPRAKRLAVDHDHETGAVRGLLCANDEFGCNVSLRRLLGDVAAARRLLAYVEKPPLEQMRDGDPRPVYEGRNVRPSVQEQTRRAVLGTPRPNPPARPAETSPAASASASPSPSGWGPGWDF
jgi:hypothetical protein